MSKIIVRRDRDDKGWIAVKEGAFHGLLNNTIFQTAADACIAAYHDAPGTEVTVDDRVHSKMGNGIVMVSGDYNPQLVTFKSRSA